MEKQRETKSPGMVKISVVVPVFNRERLIIRCLESIYKQTYPNLEIIIVDNLSEDDTVKTVKEWMLSKKESGRFIKFFIEEKRGAAAAREKGLNNSTGEYIVFFDSDDVMSSSLISEAYDNLNSNAIPDIVCWKSKLHLLNGSTRVPPFNPERPMENHLIHSLLRPQSYMVRTEFIREIGGWSKSLNVWNDLETGFRLLINNPKIKGINKILSEVYLQSDSLTGIKFSDKVGEWEKSIEEIKKELKKSATENKERISKLLNYKLIILASQYSKEGNKEAGRKLFLKTIGDLCTKDRLLLKFSYHYTRKGLRGAWRIIRPFYLRK